MATAAQERTDGYRWSTAYALLGASRKN